jgi:hypothetical protein
VYPTFTILQREATLASLAWEWQARFEGHSIHLTNNANGSRTFAHIAMHENKLYILEITIPPGYPESGLFQQSLGWVQRETGFATKPGTPTPTRAWTVPRPSDRGVNPADAAGEGGSPTRSGQ